MEHRNHDARFVDEHRAELIQRFTMVMPLADVLLSQGMLHREKYSEISRAVTEQERMRKLFEALHSGGDRVKSAFYCALRDNDPLLLQDLERKKPREMPDIADRTSIIFNYKESIISKYETVQEYNSLPGEYVLLADRYIELLIIQRHREQSEREEEIRSRGERFQQVFSTRASEAYRGTSVDQLFSPSDRGRVPNAVILQGHSGNGKSFTAQKIMHDWASGTLYAEQFDLVFHLKCKELNCVSGSNSVVELLSCNQSFTPEISQMLQHSPEKVLFLIDGFDEFKFSLEVPSESLPSDPFAPAPPEATLCALLSGHILPKCFLLVTTRSTASDRLSTLLKHPHRFTEILGFSEEGVKEYFRRFFKDKHLYTDVYDTVKANETLFTACFIPVICWIVCTVFREVEDLTRVLGTTTSIFVDFVSTLLEHHCQVLSLSVPTLLRSLGQLAERGVLEQQVLFDERRVSETVSDPSSIPFLCKFLLKKRNNQRTMFSFLHLSIQDFFTALFYVSLDEEAAQNKVRELLYNVNQMETKDHLLPVVQFLFGLSNKEVMSSLMDAHSLSASLTIRAQLEEWILNLISSRLSSHHMNLFILHCLYEFHEEDFVRKAMGVWEDIDLESIPLKKTDVWVLLYCLQFCPSIRSLNLKDCNITVELLRMLQPALCRCEELGLDVEDLLDADVGDLTSALGEGKDLIKLGVRNSSLSDESVHQVLSALSKQKSVGKVDISVNTITYNTAAELMSPIFNLQGNMRLWVTKPMVSDEESLCSSLQVGKGNDEDFWLTLSHKLPGWKCKDPESYSPPTEPALSEITLTLSNSSEISNISWRSFLQNCHQLKHLTEKCPGLDEHVEALLSFLHSVPALKKVWLKVSSLTEGWAARILSLSQACPTLQYIHVEMANPMASDEESLCSSLMVETDDDDFRLSVNNPHILLLVFSSRLQTVPALSSITLSLSHSETSNTDWRSFLRILHQLMRLSEKCAGFDEHADALLSFLHSVPALKMCLVVSSLTESWAARILSFSQACPTLQEIELSAGYCGDGMLLEEGIRLLQESQKRPDCTLIVKGLRCRKPTDQCTSYKDRRLRCNQRVKLQFCGVFHK